jgi:hypothetical protein
VATLSTVMTISALAVRKSSRWRPRFLAMDGREFSPAVSSAGDHSLSGGCLREAVGLSVGDHGGNANGLRWTLSPDGWLVCWTCSGRAGIQWVERNAESDLDLRAGQAHQLLLLGSSSLSITVRMRSAKSVTRRRIRLPRASSAR